MAIYVLQAKIIAREGRARSVIAAAAYRTGTKLRDESKDKEYNYTRRSSGVIDTTIVVPEGAPVWARETGQLWQAVENAEKRKDAQLAREFVLAVPKELSAEAQFDLAVGWAKEHLVSKGMIVEVSLYHTKSGKNPHCHLLCTTRKLDGDKFGPKAREWNDKALLVSQRESWGNAVNAALEKAGRKERVSHKSLKDQGINRIPEPKIGVAATAMKRKGLMKDPDNFRRVRQIRLLNEVRPFIMAVRHIGHVREVRQIGMGRSWWERSINFMSRSRERAKGVLKKTWHKFLDRQPAKTHKSGPGLSR